MGILLKLRSCKEAYLILEKLQKFTSRPIFKKQLKTKYEAILRQYENELTTIETWFLVRFLWNKILFGFLQIITFLFIYVILISYKLKYL